LLVIGVVTAIATAGITVILTVAVLVTIAVHQEERRMTFTLLRGPTLLARIARLMIVGRSVRGPGRDPKTVADRQPALAVPGESEAAMRTPDRDAA
jgi:hypothetical protein